MLHAILTLLLQAATPTTEVFPGGTIESARDDGRRHCPPNALFCDVAAAEEWRWLFNAWRDPELYPASRDMLRSIIVGSMSSDGTLNRKKARSEWQAWLKMNGYVAHDRSPETTPNLPASPKYRSTCISKTKTFGIPGDRTIISTTDCY